MKTKHTLTSIAVVVAASFSLGALAAGFPPAPPPAVSPSSSSASITDVQINMYNSVDNQGTENNAYLDNALQNSSGNAAVNVSAGDTNQQANAVAISTADADASFVFGHSASASIGVGQFNSGNVLSNLDVQNNATVHNSANNFSGNLGLNVAAGAFNQQKNDVTIASASKAQNADASVEVLQTAVGGTTYNGVEAGDSALNLVASGYGGYPGFPGFPGHPTQNLDVENNAGLTNSLNGLSGAAGVNIAAGGNHQQSNSLSIAAGCYACP
ncbi:hypothetical protein [Pseudomonas sp. MYb185]|uniref:hypothetical protein n=1 Tax=Pseudomonas sp. MYb185 TaxID=1848729 RepID=UPI000CFD6025|nr:hypothetical protein [Pseudomonas sp. MYb185]PRB82237.1 hypothetical protein CQ007_08785 [Pseudomonas sp. MYb185]